MEPRPYTKTLQDDLDLKLLDQLYGAVAQISSFCFETKKFCVTIQFIVLTFMIKFTNDKLDHSLFVAGLCIPLCFWFLDSTGYFYQVKLRGVMDTLRQRIMARENNLLADSDEVRIIDPTRVEISSGRRIVNAAINHSMWLYAILGVADIATWALFAMGEIQ